MAPRAAAFYSLAIASALVGEVHGDGPLCSSAAAAQPADGPHRRCGGLPGPGPDAGAAFAPSEAAAEGAAAAAAAAAEASASVQLLQAELRVAGAGGAGLLPAVGGRGGGGARSGGLRFLHIPRTGGTSVEISNMLLPPGRQAFTSLFHDTFSCLQATLFQGSSLVAIYNMTHKDMEHYSLLGMFNQCYHWMTIGHLSTRGFCLDYHYPPGYSALLQGYYRQGPTFCAVREPSARMLSALMVTHNRMGPENASEPSPSINCSAAAYDEAIARLIREELAKGPFRDSCFYAHQAEFATYCQHLIHTEALADEFAALMRSYGRNVTLPSWRVGDDWTATCNIKVANLSNSTRHLMYDFLKVDYDFLGYPPPF